MGAAPNSFGAIPPALGFSPALAIMSPQSPVMIGMVRRPNLALLSAAVGILIALWVLAFDVPVAFGWVILDARDPNNPARVTAIVISPLELVLKSLLAVGCIAAAAWLWRTRGYDDK